MTRLLTKSKKEYILLEDPASTEYQIDDERRIVLRFKATNYVSSESILKAFNQREFDPFIIFTPNSCITYEGFTKVYDLVEELNKDQCEIDLILGNNPVIM